MRNHFGAHRIQFNVSGELLQIQLALAKDGFVAALENVPDKAVLAVEESRVLPIEVAHAAPQFTI
jgi:hypothetical protein